MAGSTVAWPVKTRELHNHHFDSTMWNGFAFRDNDIVIARLGAASTTCWKAPWFPYRFPSVTLPLVISETQPSFLS